MENGDRATRSCSRGKEMRTARGSSRTAEERGWTAEQSGRLSTLVHVGAETRARRRGKLRRKQEISTRCPARVHVFPLRDCGYESPRSGFGKRAWSVARRGAMLPDEGGWESTQDAPKSQDRRHPPGVEQAVFRGRRVPAARAGARSRSCASSRPRARPARSSRSRTGRWSDRGPRSSARSPRATCA